MTRIRHALLSVLVVLTALTGLSLTPASAGAPAPAAQPVTTVMVWGDSMTLVWPAYLAQILGVPVVNMGVGGATVQETEADFDAWVTANPGRTDIGHLVWAGHVNGNSQNDDLDTVVPTLQAMAALVPRNRFMPIGLTNGPDEAAGTPGYQAVVEGVNADMAATFRFYAEVRRFLVTDGLAVAGIDPTGTDETNIAEDVPPASLRTALTGNPAHLNDPGRHVTAVRVDDLVRSAGWVLPDPRPATTTTAVSSSNPAGRRQLLRFTATVTGDSTPTGLVTFQVGKKVRGQPVPLTDGTATISASAAGLTPGNTTVTVYYGGDTTHAPSFGMFNQVVGRSG